MRRKDLSGAHVCTFAGWSMVSRISVRVDSWKISGARRFWILLDAAAEVDECNAYGYDECV